MVVRGEITDAKTVVGLLLGISTPALVWSGPVGLGLSLALFLLAVGCTRGVAEEPAPAAE